MKMPKTAIAEEIARHGVLPFARFMELALYCPETGYYEREQDNVGHRGDFITSVSAGSLFGEMLAFQFAEWLQSIDSQVAQLQIIEAGAHDGRLADDVLSWLKASRPRLSARLEYVIVEPSLNRQRWQRATLKKFPNVRWIENLEGQTFNGVFFSNELLDAFPVRRFGWDAMRKRWFEWGVTLADGKFIWAKMEGLETALPSILNQISTELLAVLPDGYIIEASPAAETWWHQAARSLERGKLLAIDYGFAADEMFSPARTRGTLRAYRRHQVSDDLLAEPGEQDLTAHVNFSAIQQAGEIAGLRTENFSPQPQFLIRILEKAVKSGAAAFATLDAKRIRQFQTLTHPEHLGRAFRVLVQAR